MMLPRKHGLIVNITAWDHNKFLVNVFYDVAKAAINRMTYGMARELRPHNIAAIALAPGFMRTERVAAAFEAGRQQRLSEFYRIPRIRRAGSCRPRRRPEDYGEVRQRFGCG